MPCVRDHPSRAGAARLLLDTRERRAGLPGSRKETPVAFTDADLSDPLERTQGGHALQMLAPSTQF